MRLYFPKSVLKFSPLALACVSAFGQYQGDYQGAPQYQGDPQYQAQNYDPNYAQQDPNDVAGRSVARISWMAGDVSVRRGDAGQTFAAALNAPLMVEDNVATAPGARAEVQLDYAQRARLGPDAEMRISALEADRYQLQLSRGFLSFSVLRNPPAQAEISTPSVAVRPLGRGNFRVWVRDDGETTITVRSGDVEVFTPRGSQQLHRGQSMLVRGTPQDPEFQVIAAAGADEWDIWNDRRDRELERAVSYRYVSQDIAGAEDLDAYGSWDNDPQYGEVWVPQVSADWAPYREGRWVWEDYYGWTWVSSEPWGWAPYHYGNWYHASFGWAWYPGAYRERHFWRPAVVGFFGYGGGDNFDLSAGFGNVGWCPLAPFETYHPWYGRGWGYGGYGNTNITNINILNNTNINRVYRNAMYGATAVNAGQFLNGGTRYVRVAGDQLQNAALVRGQLPLTPTVNNLRFSNRQTIAIPRTNFQASRFYTRSPGLQQNNLRVPFQQQQQMVQRSQQAFNRQSGAPGIRYGSQAGGVQGNQPFTRQGYNGAPMNQSTPRQFGQPGPQNNQPYARPGYNGAPMNQRSPQQFGQPGLQNNQSLTRPGYNGGAPRNQRTPQPFNGRPVMPNSQPFTRPGYNGGAPMNQRTPQQFNGRPVMPNSQPFTRPAYGNLSPPRAPQGDWSRFGQPNGAGNTPSPRAADPGTGWSAYSNRGVPFGRNPQNQARPQYNSPGFTRPPDNYRQQPRSLQLSQPMVQPRPAAPAYTAPAYRPQPAYQPSYRSAPAARPSYSAPAYRPAPESRPPQADRPQMYNAPAYRPAPQSFSAPAYRPQPAARPSYNPPAPSYRPQYSAPPQRAYQAPAARQSAPSSRSEGRPHNR